MVNNLQKEKSLGTILQARRCELKLSVADVCNNLKIKSHDIELLEQDEWEKLNKRIYTAGLVRSYVKFLKITDLDLERKIEKLSMRYDFKMSKHKLVNLDQENKLSPTKDSFFNFLLISVLLFLVLLLLYNSFEHRDGLITNKDLVKELRKIEF